MIALNVFIIVPLTFATINIIALYLSIVNIHAQYFTLFFVLYSSQNRILQKYSISYYTIFCIAIDFRPNIDYIISVSYPKGAHIHVRKEKELH